MSHRSARAEISSTAVQQRHLCGGHAAPRLGTLLVATGTRALSQYLERTLDARMRRTARRPAAAGGLTPSAVLVSE